MNIEKLIKNLKALQNAYGDYEVYLKEDENNIRIVEDVVFEEATMLDEDKTKKHRYFLIG